MNSLFLIVLLCTYFCCKKEELKSEVILKKEFVQPEGKPTYIETTSLISFHNKVLTNFYKSTNYKTVWQSKEKREVILDELSKSDQEGLNPEDYNVGKLFDFEKKSNNFGFFRSGKI